MRSHNRCGHRPDSSPTFTRIVQLWLKQLPQTPTPWLAQHSLQDYPPGPVPDGLVRASGPVQSHSTCVAVLDVHERVPVQPSLGPDHAHLLRLFLACAATQLTQARRLVFTRTVSTISCSEAAIRLAGRVGTSAVSRWSGEFSQPPTPISL